MFIIYFSKRSKTQDSSSDYKLFPFYLTLPPVNYGFIVTFCCFKENVFGSGNNQIGFATLDNFLSETVARDQFDINILSQ